MKKLRMKAKEIASVMGVSPATVSLALNDRPGVSEETKQRIFDYVNGLEAVAAPSPGGAFVKLILYTGTEQLENYDSRNLFNISYVEISRLLQQEHIELRLYNVSDKQQLQRAILSSGSDGAMGVILDAGEVPQELLSILDQCPVPLVLIGNELMGERWDAINFHDHRAIFDGMRYLEENGHRDIVYLKNSYSIFNFFTRRRSFIRYIRETRGDSAAIQIVEVGSDPETVCENLKHYLNSRVKLPDALFLENFIISIGTMMAMRELSLGIPDKLSLLGIDTLPETAFQPFDLTRFEVPHRERSAFVVRQLLSRVRGGGDFPATEIQLAMRFIPGASVRLRQANM